MPRVLLIAFVIAVTFWVVSIVDVAMQPPNRHRGLSKTGWVIVVLLIPVIGGLLWFFIGRIGKNAVAAPVAKPAPDDNPAFFSTIGSISDQDERIRRLEEELAQLDAEDDDPRWQQPPTDRSRPGGSVPDDSDEDSRGRGGQTP